MLRFSTHHGLLLALLVLPALVLTAGCQSGPRPLRYGSDTCAHCHMTASDERYGAELVTATGKVYPFDSVECLARYLDAHPEQEAGASLWVAAYDAPGTLVPAEEAFFLHADAFRSPMGLNVAAFSPAADRAAAQDAHDAVLTWADVRRLAADAGGAPGHAHG